MSFTEQEIRDKVEAYHELISYTYPIFDKYISAQEGSSHLDECSINFEGDMVYGSGDEYWHYGGHEHHTYGMPISMLWAPDLVEAMAEERKRKDEAARVQREKDKERQEAERLKREQSEWARLNRIYGGKK